ATPTLRKRLETAEPRAELAERLAPRLGVGAVEDQLAVEVVDLVLHHPCGIALELESHRRAFDVPGLELHLRGTLDGDAHRPEREAALRIRLRVLPERRDD